MIRASTLLLVALATTGCAWLPGLDFPELTVQPQYHLMKLRGEIAMQSAPTGMPPTVDNPSMPVAEFGQTKRDDDYGGVIAYGDGFSGLEFDYLNIDIDTTDRGTLSQDFGLLPAGTIVSSKFSMEQLRLSYIGQVLERETDRGWLFRLGVGAAVTYRDGKFSVLEDGTNFNQIFTFSDDGVPYALVRGRAEFGGFSLTGEYAHAEFSFGGDLKAPAADYGVTAAYSLEDQDLEIVAGYRWIELPLSGVENPFDFDADLELEGFVLGAKLTF